MEEPQHPPHVSAECQNVTSEINDALQLARRATARVHLDVPFENADLRENRLNDCPLGPQRNLSTMFAATVEMLTSGNLVREERGYRHWPDRHELAAQLCEDILRITKIDQLVSPDMAAWPVLRKAWLDLAGSYAAAIVGLRARQIDDLALRLIEDEVLSFADCHAIATATPQRVYVVHSSVDEKGETFWDLNNCVGPLDLKFEP